MPGAVLTGSDESVRAHAVSNNGESKVAQRGKNNNDAGEDRKGFGVVLVVHAVVPSGKQVIQQSEQPRRSNGIVRPNVRQDGNPFRKRNSRREDEPSKQRRKRSLNEPESERVEEQLVTAVRVLLPPRQLVVHCKTNALLKAVARIRGVPQRVAGTLQPQGHIEVLGHVRLGPVLLVVVFVLVRGYYLDS